MLHQGTKKNYQMPLLTPKAGSADCSVKRGEVMRLPRGSAVKNRLPMQETRDQSLGWEDPVEKGMATSPGFLPGESHGQRILAGHSP